MNRRILSVALLSSLVVLAASLPASAQGAGKELGFNVSFDFVADDQPLKAGQYVVSAASKESGELLIQRADGKYKAVITPVTRLARQHQGDAPKGSFVFDKVGDTRVLSEVWMPGQDGYLLKGAKGDHQHEVMDVK